MANYSPVRILIVDDEAPLMTALCRTLQDAGLDPVGFTSPSLALEAIKDDKFEVLLTDLMMPEMDGISLVSAAIAIDPNLACVIMTGHGTITTAVEAMKVGALDYILKPFKASTALPIIERAREIRHLRIENLLLHEQQRENLRKLEIQNEELGLFSAAASHDLRAPLNRIGSFVYLLEEAAGNQLNKEALESLEYIKTSVNEMKSLIAGLMDLAMVRQVELKVETIDLASMARRQFNVLKGSSQNPNIRLDIESDLEVTADEELLGIALTNLIGNSVKYSSKSENPVITIGRDQSDPRHPFFVKDNGVGFDATRADKLFVPFKRLHSSRDFTGSGIGLSTVQRIIQRHHGEIWATSELGHGATFFFTLESAQKN